MKTIKIMIVVAVMDAGRLPEQVYALFKEPCNDISKELVEFKESFSQKYPNVPVLSFQDVNTLRNHIKNILINRM